MLLQNGGIMIELFNARTIARYKQMGWVEVAPPAEAEAADDEQPQSETKSARRGKAVKDGD